MKRVRLLLALLLAAASTVVSADDIDMFKRLQNQQVRLASAQNAQDADFSDSYPTQYVDPNDLDDISTVLIEQDAVPAESAAQGQIGGGLEYATDGAAMADPVADRRVACGCGEAPMPNSWDASASASCCTSARPVRRPGCHPRRGQRARCDVAASLSCESSGCDEAQGCHLPRRPRSGSGCHMGCAVGGHGGCHRGCAGGNCGHLLRHIRCCR